MKQLLKEPYTNECLTISPDLWSDKYKQISYLGVSVTFVDEFHKFVTFDLFCKPFPETEKTGENILNVLEDEMKKFDIFDLSKTTIVCDRGSNFLKAFQHLYPITCYAHRLNNVLKRSFFQHEKQPSASSSISIEKSCTSDEPDISPYIPSKPVKTIKKSIVYTKTIEKSVIKTKLIDTPSAVHHLIKTIIDCKSLAKFVKKSGLNKEIQEAGGVALHQAITILWLSLINLLETIDTSFTQLKIILHSRKQQQRLCVINQH
ncbi:unnamed protein product [Rotaria magnacalcarata]|uniref:Uncharacterized protein n=1 Tax=Rotaria magnacalcarata TaxID=392030 RepID=A0A816E3D9_9BILA|nr:unnamed protein product [Rotaria magnacalcarata]CAF1640888.1 unnamed protein product [Rotaria magnacalcarata]CAF3981113.1 unnamed protein product [Rotaria magnacalcarata]CAF4309179.1 unnamed protein product [Rotaria magnacalcarata]